MRGDVRNCIGAVWVTREQVIGYRVAAQGLHRERHEPARDWRCSTSGCRTPRASGAARVRRAAGRRRAGADVIGPDQPLALVWSLRGAPHVHRRGDLDDAGRRRSTRCPRPTRPAAERDRTERAAKAGIAALEQFAIAVAAMRAVVRTPTAKGAASTAVTKTIPKAMWRDCRACQAQHISDSAMRSAVLAAGLEFSPARRRPCCSDGPRAEPAEGAGPGSAGRR